MRKSQVVILSLAAMVILTATQLPYATTLQTRADYAAAMDRASAEYRDARIECRPIVGHDQDMCVVVARAAEKRAKAAADATYWGTIKSKADRSIANADADWMIARASCDARLHPDKAACVQNAKAANIRTVAAVQATYGK
jgi:hypothetical protein